MECVCAKRGVVVALSHQGLLFFKESFGVFVEFRVETVTALEDTVFVRVGVDGIMKVFRLRFKVKHVVFAGLGYPAGQFPSKVRFDAAEGFRLVF